MTKHLPLFDITREKDGSVVIVLLPIFRIYQRRELLFQCETSMKSLIKTRLYTTSFMLACGLAAVVPAIAADLHVPTTSFPTIQSAIDTARTGDTIHVAAGVYTEQVRITSKKLTLTGQPGTVLRATEKMLPFISPFPGVPYVGVFSMLVELSDVTVRGLTFEGERLAEHFVGDGPQLGLFFMRSSGSAENCSFYGFRGSTFGAEDSGGIWVRTFEDDDITVRIANCTFADSTGAIFLRGGPTRQTITATIENNTILGLGPIATALGSAGIDVRPGVGGRIVGNTISGFSETGTVAQFPISFGIVGSDVPTFLALQPLLIEGNILRDNQMHISLAKANRSVIRNNHFQGSAPGIVPMGLSVSGTDVTIANNQFNNMPEGIRLLGDDPIPGFGLGDILGFAVNAQVTSNRFCNVTIPINRQMPATATETGTFTNDCSIPLLTVAPAVVLSWLDDGRPHLLESAPDPAGPWSLLNAKLTVHDGQVNFLVRADTIHQFFRLR